MPARPRPRKHAVRPQTLEAQQGSPLLRMMNCRRSGGTAEGRTSGRRVGSNERGMPGKKWVSQKYTTSALCLSVTGAAEAATQTGEATRSHLGRPQAWASSQAPGRKPL